MPSSILAKHGLFGRIEDARAEPRPKPADTGAAALTFRSADENP
jgi:hypothetical protein